VSARSTCTRDRTPLGGAVRAVFPEAELYLREWHLHHPLKRLLAKVRQSEQQHRSAIVAVLPRVEATFTGAAS
jgi:hypothetical protein